MARKSDAPLTDEEREMLLSLQNRDMQAQAKVAQEEAATRAALRKPLADAIHDPKIDELIDAAKVVSPSLPFGDELVAYLPSLVTILNRLREPTPKVVEQPPIIPLPDPTPPATA